jgi:hypothetical protein
MERDVQSAGLFATLRRHVQVTAIGQARIVVVLGIGSLIEREQVTPRGRGRLGLRVSQMPEDFTGEIDAARRHVGIVGDAFARHGHREDMREVAIVVLRDLDGIRESPIQIGRCCGYGSRDRAIGTPVHHQHAIAFKSGQCIDATRCGTRTHLGGQHRHVRRRRRRVHAIGQRGLQVAARAPVRTTRDQGRAMDRAREHQVDLMRYLSARRKARYADPGGIDRQWRQRRIRLVAAADNQQRRNNEPREARSVLAKGPRARSGGESMPEAGEGQGVVKQVDQSKL